MARLDVTTAVTGVDLHLDLEEAASLLYVLNKVSSPNGTTSLFYNILAIAENLCDLQDGDVLPSDLEQFLQDAGYSTKLQGSIILG